MIYDVSCLSEIYLDSRRSGVEAFKLKYGKFRPLQCKF